MIKALCRARQVGVNLSFRLQFHNYDERRTDSTDIFTIWHFFLYLRLWWKYNFYKGSYYKHKETSLRKVIEVNPLWESCLYEVAEAAFSPNFYILIFGTLVIFVLFCFVLFWCFFFNYTEIEELRVDIKSYRGMKVKLKLFMHKEHYHSIDYSIFIVKLC